MLALGVLNLVRFGPELFMGGLSSSMAYWELVLIDAAGGVLSICAGIGLMQPRRWGWNVTMAAWGSMIANALLWAWVCREGIWGEGIHLLVPRLLFFPLVLLLSAYGLWAVMMRMNEEKGSRATLSLWFASAAVATAGALWGTRSS